MNDTRAVVPGHGDDGDATETAVNKAAELFAIEADKQQPW